MIFKKSSIEGMLLIDLDKREDERGFFARTFCLQEFKEQGVEFSMVQSNMSHSKWKGTMRGLHYQTDGKEAKVVRCTNGALFDVVLDLRPDSPTFLKYEVNELSETNKRQLYIPAGCAHGFLTLQPATEINYMVSAPYAPGLEKGLRFDDPLLKEVNWPIPIEVITEKDKSYPDLVIADL